MFNEVFGFLARAVLLQDDAEGEEGGGVLLRGRLLPGPAAERQGLKVPDLQSARPVSTEIIKCNMEKLTQLEKFSKFWVDSRL